MASLIFDQTNVFTLELFTYLKKSSYFKSHVKPVIIDIIYK